MDSRRVSQTESEPHPNVEDAGRGSPGYDVAAG